MEVGARQGKQTSYDNIVGTCKKLKISIRDGNFSSNKNYLVYDSLEMLQCTILLHACLTETNKDNNSVMILLLGQINTCICEEIL